MQVLLSIGFNEAVQRNWILPYSMEAFSNKYCFFSPEQMTEIFNNKSSLKSFAQAACFNLDNGSELAIALIGLPKLYG